MPTLKHQTPKYSHHKPSGQARVRIAGNEHWLGRYGSPESRARYDALVADYLAHHRQQEAGLTIGQLVAIYWRHCKRKYGQQGRGQFGYAQDYRPILRLMRQHFGKMTAASFGPKSLRRLQEEGIRAGCCDGLEWSLANGRCEGRWRCVRRLIPIPAGDGLAICVNNGGIATDGSAAAICDGLRRHRDSVQLGGRFAVDACNIHSGGVAGKA